MSRSRVHRHAAHAARVAERAERFAERAVQQRQTRSDRWSSELEARRTARRQAAVADKNVNKQVLGAVLLAIGGNWLLAELGLFSLGWPGLLAIALVTLGVAMIATAKVGRTKPLVALGIVLTLALAMSSSVAPVAAPRFGDATHAPRSNAALRDNYTLTAGELTLDLSSMELEDSASVRARVVAGELEVIVPDGIGLEIDADVGVGGQVKIFDDESDGFSPSLDHSRQAVDAAPTLTLDLDVSAFGQITVEQAS